MIGAAPIAVRMLAGVGTLALLVAAAFAVALTAMSSLRGSTNDQVRVNRVTAATLRVERVVDELDQSLRGFVLTRNERIRDTWVRAQADLPAAAAELQSSLRSQPAEARIADTVIERIRSYVSDYGTPLIAIALESPPAATSSAASTEGLTRIGQVRAGLSQILAHEDRLAASHASSARSQASRAVLVGVLALGAAGIVILLVLGYLVRSVAQPVRSVAGGAARIAAGDFSIRMRSGGPAEIRGLTRAFNSMAASLEQGRAELERQNEQLRESERAKSELITIVSHELRTPLASILGYTSLILRRDVDAETLHRYLTIINDQGRRLSGLVDDFMSAEAGGARLELETAPVDLAEVLRSEVELAGPGAEGHELHLDAPDGLTVSGDRDRLAQVVGNMLANAIKYSPEGGRVLVRGDRAGSSVRVSVQDEGIGIPAEHQPRVFTKFFRGAARESGIAGVGLGLAVAREIVEAHGGRMAFWSTEDEGSTFWFELPAAGD